MLTGDKGKTARMIGVQCGMFTANTKDSNDKSTKLEPNDDILEEQKMNSSVSLKYKTNVIYTEEHMIDKSDQVKVILHEVKNDATDIDSEIRRIL